MVDASQLVSEYVKDFQPYAPIEPPAEIAARIGLPIDQVIKLDANENPYGVPKNVLDSLSTADGMHIYPDPCQRESRKLIGNYCGFPSDNIVIGNGSDELLDLICRIFLKPDDVALGFSPTFSYYDHVVKLNHGQYRLIPRNDKFEIDISKLSPEAFDNVKIAFLCSPNNPTGNTINEETLDYFLKKNVVVVLDEAYFEFCRRSMIEKVKERNNLIVLRTFSKVFALAGFRIGYGVMDAKIAQLFMSVKPPYSITVPAEVALKTSLQSLESFDAQVNEMSRTREDMISELKSVDGLEPFPSESNFVLIKVTGKDAKEVQLQLEKVGLLVRYYSSEILKNYIRVSIGTPKQIQFFLASIKVIMKT